MDSCKESVPDKLQLGAKAALLDNGCCAEGHVESNSFEGAPRTLPRPKINYQYSELLIRPNPNPTLDLLTCLLDVRNPNFGPVLAGHVKKEESSLGYAERDAGPLRLCLKASRT